MLLELILPHTVWGRRCTYRIIRIVLYQPHISPSLTEMIEFHFSAMFSQWLRVPHKSGEGTWCPIPQFSLENQELSYWAFNHIALFTFTFLFQMLCCLPWSLRFMDHASHLCICGFFPFLFRCLLFLPTIWITLGCS